MNTRRTSIAAYIVVGAIATLALGAACLEYFSVKLPPQHCLTAGGYPGVIATSVRDYSTGNDAPTAGESVLCVGVWKEVSASALPATGYSTFEQVVLNEQGDSIIKASIVLDGRNIELGDRGQSSHIVATNPEWLVWTSGTSGDSKLYARHIATGMDELVHSGRFIGNVKISEGWVVFALESEELGDSSPEALDSHSNLTADLFAYSLGAKTIEKLPGGISVTSPASFSDAFALYEDGVVWVEYDSTGGRASLKLFDLASNTELTLDAEVERPTNISYYDDLVVWRNTDSWMGYSIGRAEAFRVPTLSFAGSIYAVPAGLEWVIYQGDGSKKYYQAPLLEHRR